MTEPVKENLTIFRGGTYKKRFTFLYTDDSPVDVTGWSARMHIREDWDSPAKVLELTSENGKIEITPLLGVFDIEIPSADTEDLTIDAGVYDLEAVAPAEAEVVKLAYGKVKVMPEATRVDS